MKTNLDKMREKIFKLIDSNSNYSIEDFNAEFAQVNHVENYKIALNFENKSNNPNPEYATAGSSGFDLRANLEKDVWIGKGKREIIPTGLYFEIPENFEIQIRPRSGLAAKNGITVLNTPGTIDADYRGEIKIILINHGEIPFCVKHGDRIAQAVFASVIGENVVNLSQVDKISDNTQRSSGGFGSTGLH
jgi:dUTP pyrophosphatase